MVRSVCVFNKTVTWLEEHPNKSSFISQALRSVKTFLSTTSVTNIDVVWTLRLSPILNHPCRQRDANRRSLLDEEQRIKDLKRPLSQIQNKSK